MSLNSKNLWQLFVISILIISLVSFTLCTDDEDNDDDNGDGNGNGGNGTDNGDNGDNNTTNGESIKFIDIHHIPDMPGTSEAVQFYAKVESDNPIVEVNVIVCNEQGVCYAPLILTETPPNSKEFTGDFPAPPGLESGDKLSYHLTAKDSLDTIKESKDYEYTIL